MCGIAGFIDAGLAAKPDALEAQVLAMSEGIRHRGPDGHGTFLEADAGLAFAHRRLAIVDLSPAGAQPMSSACGRYVICYNGEIYNADEMRRDAALSHVRWRGHSDTEVILEYTAARGLAAMLEAANGMFALAVWDRQEKLLHLARDRMGIKPLFVARLKRGLAFASELKALLPVAGFEAQIDPAAVAGFLRFAYVPAPGCIYRGVRKLLPGERATIPLDAAWRGEPMRHSHYWSLRETAEAGMKAPVTLRDDEAVDHLEALLKSAVRSQMMSDVPLGALLSGGIDSSAVVAMMVGGGAQAVRTFSIGFDNAEFDESQHAAAIAGHLGTAHTQLRVTPQEALAVIPQLAAIYDEPFADSSQIPTYLVSKLTRQHVTVALSGDGGDELFAGYNRHRFAAGLGGRLRRLPGPARKAARAVLSAVPAQGITAAAAFLPARLRATQVADKVRKLARVLPLDDAAAYLSLTSQIDDPAALAPALAPFFEAGQQRAEPPLPHLLEEMQYRDMQAYLPDDILQKVDRASMAVALEVRPPLLDHRIVEFAWRLPAAMKIRRGETKWLLRRVLERHVPRTLTDRPKMGFAIPLEAWLRGPLSEWVSDTLAFQGALMDMLDRKAVADLWQRHRSGSENLAYALWPVLMLATWQRTRLGAP